MAEFILRNENSYNLPRSDLQQVQEFLLESTSMGGARPKAVVEDENSLWIAKFSSPYDRWNFPLVEFSLLNLAKKCGINVADHKMTRSLIKMYSWLEDLIEISLRMVIIDIVWLQKILLIKGFFY